MQPPRMSSPDEAPAQAGRRIDAGLVLIFLLSGMGGLVYEVVWMRMLVRTFGITIYAVSTVLVVFMGGLALGSFLAARGRRWSRRPLFAYGLIEIGIGLTAAVSSAVMPSLPRVFAELSGGAEGATVVALRFGLSALVLLPPTVLMGATLPVLSAHLATRKSEVGLAVGLLYGINTLGAVFGVATAGFVSLGLFGEQATTWGAAALNTVCGLLALALARGTPPLEAAPAARKAGRVDPQILVLYAVSGFCAIALQVVWSRMLILLLGISVYGFSSMLSMYLLGIAVGSVVMARYVDRIQNLLRTFAILEIANALTAVLSIHTYVALGLSRTDEKYLYSTLWSLEDFTPIPLHAALVVLPTTLILGAIFPVVTRLVTDGGGEDGTQEGVGRLYGWNTVGAICGSLATGFVLIPGLGTLMSFLVVAFVSLGIGLYLFVLHGRRSGTQVSRPVLVGLAGYLLLAGLGLEDPTLQIVKARLPEGFEVLAHEEDRAATVTVVQSPENRALHINGLHVSGTGFLSRFMSILGLTLHPEPEKALIVALGVGEAYRGAVDYGVDTTVAELVETVVAHFPYYEPDADRYLKADNSRIAVADGRNYLLRTDERFDFVLVDVSPPLFSAGAVNVYSAEFIELVRDHLTEDGIFALWVPLPCFEADFWTIARSFTDTFPHTRAWHQRGFQGTLLLGTKSGDVLGVGVAELQDRLRKRRSPLPEPLGNWARYIDRGRVLTDAELRAYAGRYPRVTDDRPRTEFPLFRFADGETYRTDADFLNQAKTSTTSGGAPATELP